VGRLSAAVAVVGVVLACWLTRDWWLPAPPPPATQPESWKPRPPLTADELANLPDPLKGWRRDRVPESLLASVVGDAPGALPELVGVLGNPPFRLPQKEPAHWPTQSPDGRLVALPCGKTVVLYDAATGAVVHILKGHTAQTHVGDFSADGKRFACGATNGAIWVWDVDTGEKIRPFHDGANDVWGTIFSPDGKSIVTGAAQGAVKVWDAADGRYLKTLDRHHQGGATFLAFNPKGTRLATAGVDKLVQVWDWPSGDHLKTLITPKGHKEQIQDLAFNADGALLASGSQDCVVVWDVATFLPRHTLPTAGNGVLGFTPDGGTLVAGPHDVPDGQTRAFTRWNVETGAQHGKARGVPGPRGPGTMCGRLSRDGRTVYLMNYNPPEARLGAYDAGTCTARYPNPGHSGRVWSVAFRPDGCMLASGGVDGQVCLWDLESQPGATSPPARQLGVHRNYVWAVTFSPDGRLLASSSTNGQVILWDVATGQIVHEFFSRTAKTARRQT
jgi:WD40 repeat protein